MKGIGVRLAAMAAAIALVTGSFAVHASAEKAKNKVHFGGNSENDDWEFNRQAEDNQYLLPDADTYFITEKNISWMDDNELILARNEFFARRGRKFSTKWISDYFSKQKWYHAKIEEKQFTSYLFNTYELTNLNFISAYEAKRREKRKKKVNKVRMSGPNEAPSEYDEIFEEYDEAIRAKWQSEESESLGLKWVSSDDTTAESLGYTSLDLNDDGQEEFLICPTDTKKFGEGAVFAIYTIEDGAPVQVAASDGNINYYICDGNLIRREEVSDEGRWNIGYFGLQGTKLVCSNVLVMDESGGAKEPWYSLKSAKKLKGFETDEDQAADARTAEGDTDAGLDGVGGDKSPDKDNLEGTDAITLESLSEEQVSALSTNLMTSITADQANEIRAAHTAEALELTPFELEDGEAE